VAPVERYWARPGPRQVDKLCELVAARDYEPALRAADPIARALVQHYPCRHHGELPGGTQLKVRDLAEQVGTSVMPVREAIRRLEESGLAAREPHKGAVVKSLTMPELV
jgi:hypothetical protein